MRSRAANGSATWRDVRQRPLGAGLGYRRELAGDLLYGPSPVDLVEVTADWFFDDVAGARQLRRLLGELPVFLHAIRLSPATARPLCRRTLAKLKRVAEALEPVCVTEHLAFCGIDGYEIGHLTPPPFGPQAAAVLAERLAAAQAYLGLPLAVENIARSYEPPGSTWSEARFIREVVEAADVGMLLDLENVHANGRNFGFDAHRFLEELPLERVVCVHVTGGTLQADGHYVDNHSAATPEQTWRLLEALAKRTQVPAVVIERDAAFPPFEELAAEVNRARSILGATAATSSQDAVAHPEPINNDNGNDGGSTTTTAPLDLAQWQRATARLLTEPELRTRFAEQPQAALIELGVENTATREALATAWPPAAVERTAQGLIRKRFREASQLCATLVEELGEQLAKALFTEHATHFVPVGSQFIRADAAAFCQSVAESPKPTDEQRKTAAQQARHLEHGWRWTTTTKGPSTLRRAGLRKRKRLRPR